MDSVYVGLLRADMTEPCVESGYTRVEVPCANLKDLYCGRQIVFPDAMAPGYGVITSVAVYDKKFGGEVVDAWNLLAPQDVHEGVVPLLYNGTLYRGMEVQAKVELGSMDLCGTGG
jgi:hypothetical protein